MFLLAKRARIAFQPSAKYSELAAETRRLWQTLRPRAQTTLRNQARCRLLPSFSPSLSVSATVLSPQTLAPPTSSTLPGR